MTNNETTMESMALSLKKAFAQEKFIAGDCPQSKPTHENTEITDPVCCTPSLPLGGSNLSGQCLLGIDKGSPDERCQEKSSGST